MSKALLSRCKRIAGKLELAEQEELMRWLSGARERTHKRAADKQLKDLWDKSKALLKQTNLVHTSSDSRNNFNFQRNTISHARIGRKFLRVWFNTGSGLRYSRTVDSLTILLRNIRSVPDAEFALFRMQGL